MSSLGLDPSRLERAWRLLRQAVDERVTPGAVAVVARRDGQLDPVAVGWATLEPEPVPVTGDTLYDLASLTKVVATAPAVWALIEDGEIRLDDPVRRFVPEFRGEGRDQVTLRHLLSHTSGLPAHARLDRSHLDRERAVSAICRRPLESAPGAVIRYTDLGFMLLREVVEKAAAAPFDAFVRERIHAPLGMTRTVFRPDDELAPRCAATELVPGEGRIHGRVHDENARHVFDGVAGHAGLFAPAGDLARYARMLLNGGALDGRRVLAPATVRAMTAVVASAPGQRRTLGWAAPAGDAPSCGDLFGPNAFGHTGFTGTSLWIEPDLDLAVVLLTNRVYYGRDRTAEGIQRLRARFHNAVASAVR
ncbi:MAG: beta-lactamase family protein [Clostridia bacterium]|nr:beta-lactamase family protein [Clostridia bacterium]